MATDTITFEVAGSGELEYITDPNYTYYDEFQNYTYCGEIGLQNFDAVSRPVLYSGIFLMGVAGNGLMITVLLRRLRLLRIAEIYLLHLALADLVLLFTLPFDIVESATGWLFGETLCKLKGLIHQLNLFCGCFLLACIGFDRYLAIVHAVTSMQSRRPRTVHLTCVVLWLVCLGLSLPNVAFLNVTNGTICSYGYFTIHANNWVLTSRVFEHVCFFLPLAVMIYCYTAVVITLRNSQKSQARRGAIRLALLVTFVFCVCWLPYNITMLIDSMEALQVFSFKDCTSYDILKASRVVTKSLGFSHCCLNPFLYAFVGVRFRNELIQLLYELGCSRVCIFFRVQGHSRPVISDGATTTSSIFV